MDKFDSCVRKHLRDFIADNDISDAKSDVLYDRRSAIVSALRANYKESALGGSEVSGFLYNLFCYELTSATFLFKQAMQDFGYSSKEDFYKMKWFSKVGFMSDAGEVMISLSDVYKICTSPEFFDLRIDADAKTFVKGKASAEEVRSFLQVAVSLGVIEESAVAMTVEDIFSADSPLFAQLGTADSFKENLITVKCESVLKDLVPRICDNLRSEVLSMKGLRQLPKCSIVVEDVEGNITERLVMSLVELGFVTEFTPRGDALVCDVTLTSDERDYSVNLSETEVEAAVAAAKTGYDFYFIATYCRVVLAPKLTKDLVRDVVTALNEVRIKDDFVKIVKRKTILPVYENFYNVLKQKNFSVEDFENYFILRW